MVERASLAAVAIAVAILGGLWLHSASLQADAQSIAERAPQTLSAQQVDHALSLFERSRAHTPDTTPITFEAGLLIRLGRDRQALALLMPVVRREPQNLTAWVLTADASATVDPSLERTAIARATALNPLGARAR